MACPVCGADRVTRTEPGAFLDTFRCRDCGHVFTRVAPAAKRIALVAGLTVLTGGLDLGAIGGLAASLFLGGDGDA
jgi:transposase-like protein